MTLDGLSNELRAALVPPDGQRAKISVVNITPDEANHILNMMSHTRHRKINPAHAGMVADTMANNGFIPYREITFAPDHDGNPVLIDGQHNLLSMVSAGWTGT